MVIVNCDLFKEQIEQYGIKHMKLWRKVTALSLRLGMLFRKMRIYRFGNINKKLEDINDDCIVVFDNGIKENSVLKWLAKRYCNSRLIFYYWNPVFTSISPKKVPEAFELWSYSPSDCKRYNMKYNPTFYFKSFERMPVPKKRDVVFVGKNKGRFENLKKIENILDDCHLTSLFYITASHPRLKQRKYKKFISYDNVLNMVNESTAILDYYVDPWAGLSLRVMESMFFEKKIITNSKMIKKYDFYRPENIFVLENDNSQDLKEFIKKPFVGVGLDIKKRYLFENWMTRFSKTCVDEGFSLDFF